MNILKDAEKINAITACTEKDIPTIMEVALQSYNENYLHLWHDKGVWYKERSFNQDVLLQEMSDANARFYLLNNESEMPVGFLKLNLHKKLEPNTDTDCLELERIYLIKAGAGKGLGKKAIEFTIDLAHQLNKKMVWLKTMDTGTAMFFYEKIGFQKIGTTRLDFELMKEELRGMIVYKCDL